MSWVKGDGAKIKIVFDSPLVGDVTGKQNSFTVTVPEYTYVPGGTIQNVVKTVASTYAGDTAYELILEMEPLKRFESAAGNITVAYNGAGGLAGQGGAVQPFTTSFTPVDLVPKPDQNDAEHIEIGNVTAVGTLTRIYYTNTVDQEQGHINISGISATGTLTHVNDI